MPRRWLGWMAGAIALFCVAAPGAGIGQTATDAPQCLRSALPCLD